MTKNPNWARDELILALNLYFSCGRVQLDSSDMRVKDLSQLLNQLPIHSKELRQQAFRNPNGVSMKLGNFLSLDPNYSGKGLSQGSKLEKEIWDEFFENQYLLHQIASQIKLNFKNVLADETVTYETQEEFREGTILSRIHKRKERNPQLIKKKKEQVLKKTGALRCEVCDFDFFKVYGVLGKGFIECHHLIPLSELDGERKTKLSELAIVCANCHRMLHRSSNLLTPSELKKLIQSS